jgi:hypothetical protein
MIIICFSSDMGYKELVENKWGGGPQAKLFLNWASFCSLVQFLYVCLIPDFSGAVENCTFSPGCRE